jgi:hypothetical protein
MYRVNIDVYLGKAYLPTQAIFESGLWVDVEPVFTAALDVDELTEAAKKVIVAGHQTLPDPTREEWLHRKDPVLLATGARSWKALARNGAAYSISERNGEIRLDMTFTDKKGRWLFNPEKARTFPEGTSLSDIVRVILEDIQSREEVQWKAS